MKLNSPQRKRRGGYATVSVLLFIMIVSTLVIGITSNVVAHQNRNTVDARYAAALNLAEAGANYEFLKDQQHPRPGGPICQSGIRYHVDRKLFRLLHESLRQCVDRYHPALICCQHRYCRRRKPDGQDGGQRLLSSR